jgi:hypothetical protein
VREGVAGRWRKVTAEGCAGVPNQLGAGQLLGSRAELCLVELVTKFQPGSIPPSLVSFDS